MKPAPVIHWVTPYRARLKHAFDATAREFEGAGASRRSLPLRSICRKAQLQFADSLSHLQPSPVPPLSATCPQCRRLDALALRATHRLKVWPEFYERIVDGSKPFEVRNDDRGYQVGDVLFLREWVPQSSEYTGRAVFKRITYVGRFGVLPGFCVLGLGEVTP